jgi:hypothetical protein
MELKPWRMAGHLLAVIAVTLLVAVLAPAVLLAGELVNRRYRRRGRLRRPALLVLRNPLWIALTAPARWLLDHLRPKAGSRRRRGGNGPPGAGVREPRRPLPDLPAGAMALPGPGPFD